MMRRVAIVFLLAWTTTAQAKITGTDWGTHDGQAVRLYTLTNGSGTDARITNYGGVITAITLRGKDGTRTGVVEGFDSLADYTDPKYNGRFGSVIGRYANRIKDQTYVLDGIPYHVTKEGKPYDERVWDARAVDGTAPRLVLSLTDPDGSQGFPGTLKVTVTYTLTRDGALRIHYHATADRPTIASLTNHSYFNMAGGGSVLGQLLTMNADRYTIADEQNVPTGEIRAVAGTPFDFRTPTPIGAYIDDPDPMLVRAKGYDHNFVINGAPGTLRLAARLEDPVSGRTLEEWTTQAGVQVYSANYPPPPVAVAKGYAVHGAVALEAEAFPNSPNIAAFPSVRVTPGKPLDEVTEFRFSAP